MALKNWKKSKTGNRFVDSKTRKVLLLQHISERGKGLEWKVVVFQGARINKYFKTKKQALAYAKAYMRKH